MGTKLILTTVPVDYAEGISEELVKEKAAACVNVIDVGLSVYFWEDRIVKERERLLIIKTDESSLDAALSLLRRIHPYKVPEMIVLSPESVNEEYNRWVKGYTSGG